MNGDRSEIRRILVEELAAHREVVFAYVFGSFLEDRQFRDIDLGVWFLAKQEEVVHRDLADVLRRTLERKIKVEIDVVPLNTVSDALIYHASRGELVLDRDGDMREAVITGAWKRYWDFAFKRDAYLRDVAETAPTR